MLELSIGLTAPQLEFMQATEPYVDFEGAIRTGKSTMLCRKIFDYGVSHPGICCALTRWTQDTLDAQLKPLWRQIVSDAGVPVTWHPEGGYDQFWNGSRVYLRALKASEDTMKFGKLAGLTLAVLGIDQAEQVEDHVYFAYVPARLSQVGYPHQTLLTPNPPEPDHWICQEYPEDQSRRDQGFRYIRASLADMVPILGADYVAEQYRRYPPGSPERRGLIEGRRGLTLGGEAVYKGYFSPHIVDDEGHSRRWHVAKGLVHDDTLPIFEAWDFAYSPAVLWSQRIRDQWRILGEAFGANLSVNDFLHLALAERAQHFPHAKRFETVCDPSGWARNPQGINVNPVGLLHDAGVYPAPHEEIKNFNDPALEYNAIQQTKALMRELAGNGRPRFLVDERCAVFIAGLEGGYVWSDRTFTGSRSSIRVVEKLKDKRYNHLQDCWLYTLLRWGGASLTQEQYARAQHRQQVKAVQAAQRDPAERFRWAQQRGQSHDGRGGY